MNTSSTGNTVPDGPRALEFFQAVPTTNAADLEAFRIGDAHFLAVANYYDTETFNINSDVYRWDDGVFVPFQELPTSGAYSFESFAIDGEHYLAVANYYDDASFVTNSRVWRWDGGAFVPFQDIPTRGAFDVEAFSLGAQTWLAFANEVAEGGGDFLFDQDSTLHLFEAGAFAETYAFGTHGAHDITHFRIGATDYLAAANYYQDRRGGTSGL